MLRYQLNPHFLFNTLNSISTLVLLKQTERANAMLARLSSFLRYTLANEPTAQGHAGAGGRDAEALSRDREDAVRGSAAAPFRHRGRTIGARLPSLLAPAAGRERDQICSHAERRTARTSDRRAAARGRPSGSKSRTAARRCIPAACRRAHSTGVGLANIRDRLAQAYGPAHRFETDTERARAASALSSKSPYDSGTTRPA